MQRKNCAALVCCSNARPRKEEKKIEELICFLRGMGFSVLPGELLYERQGVFGGTGRERAKELMRFYRDPAVKVIFDISGGDIANGILPFLDFDVIAASRAEFWGYSDLTTVINAIYVKTGKTSVLWQARNLVGADSENQQRRFASCAKELCRAENAEEDNDLVWKRMSEKSFTDGSNASKNLSSDSNVLLQAVPAKIQQVLTKESSGIDYATKIEGARGFCRKENESISADNLEKKQTSGLRPGGDGLFDFDYRFVRGTAMRGIVTGGNTRCFLKLAGTPYWPDLRGKILLLESLGGGLPQMDTAFAQLQQMGAFDQAAGLLLGTFTHLETTAGPDAALRLALSYTPKQLPIARTAQIGHGADARAIRIGEEISLN